MHGSPRLRWLAALIFTAASALAAGEAQVAAAARAWLAYLRSDEAREIIRSFGYTTP